MNTFTGTNSSDTIKPSLLSFGVVADPLGSKPNNDRDIVYAKDGADTVETAGGDDSIQAGSGDDIVRAGAGADTVVGDSGNDILYCGAGDDTNVNAGVGNDYLNGQLGNDWLKGFFGDDKILGGEGNDMLEGEEGNDLLVGGLGADLIAGGYGDFDTFDYNSIFESVPTSRDEIFQFTGPGSGAGDKFDFRTIDADGMIAGNQKFLFIGTDDFTQLEQFWRRCR